MKIKLSKSQWEGIGKKAGWDHEISYETCEECKSKCSSKNMKNFGGKRYCKDCVNTIIGDNKRDNIKDN